MRILIICDLPLGLSFFMVVKGMHLAHRVLGFVRLVHSSYQRRKNGMHVVLMFHPTVLRKYFHNMNIQKLKL